MFAAYIPGPFGVLRSRLNGLQSHGFNNTRRGYRVPNKTQGQRALIFYHDTLTHLLPRDPQLHQSFADHDSKSAGSKFERLNLHPVASKSEGPRHLN